MKVLFLLVVAVAVCHGRTLTEKEEPTLGQIMVITEGQDGETAILKTLELEPYTMDMSAAGLEHAEKHPDCKLMGVHHHETEAIKESKEPMNKTEELPKEKSGEAAIKEPVKTTEVIPKEKIDKDPKNDKDDKKIQKDADHEEKTSAVGSESDSKLPIDATKDLEKPLLQNKTADSITDKVTPQLRHILTQANEMAKNETDKKAAAETTKTTSEAAKAEPVVLAEISGKGVDQVQAHKTNKRDAEKILAKPNTDKTAPLAETTKTTRDATSSSNKGKVDPATVAKVVDTQDLEKISKDSAKLPKSDEKLPAPEKPALTNANKTDIPKARELDLTKLPKQNVTLTNDDVKLIMKQNKEAIKASTKSKRSTYSSSTRDFLDEDANDDFRFLDDEVEIPTRSNLKYAVRTSSRASPGVRSSSYDGSSVRAFSAPIRSSGYGRSLTGTPAKEVKVNFGTGDRVAKSVRSGKSGYGGAATQRAAEDRTFKLGQSSFSSVRNSGNGGYRSAPVQRVEVIREVPVIQEVEVIREVPVVREVEVIREVPVVKEVEVIREVPVRTRSSYSGSTRKLPTRSSYGSSARRSPTRVGFESDFSDLRESLDIPLVRSFDDSPIRISSFEDEFQSSRYKREMKSADLAKEKSKTNTTLPLITASESKVTQVGTMAAKA